MLFVGDKGQLLADYGKRILLPEDQYKDFKPPEQTIPPSAGHYQEWINGAKTGSPTLCNFDYSGKLVENNLLGSGRLPGEPEAGLGRPEPEGPELPGSRCHSSAASIAKAGCWTADGQCLSCHPGA